MKQFASVLLALLCLGTACTPSRTDDEKVSETTVGLDAWNDMAAAPAIQADDSDKKSGFVQEYNLRDSNGLKEGIWVNEYPAERVETNYYNGKRHGVCVAYSRKSNKISSIGEYRNNAMSGTWYMFDDYGILLYKVEDIVENKDYYSFADGTRYYGGKPKHKAHCVNYYPNGNVESEGAILFSDSFESESSQYGMWKYYDEKGNLIKTEVIEGVKKI